MGGRGGDLFRVWVWMFWAGVCDDTMCRIFRYFVFRYVETVGKTLKSISNTDVFV